MTQDTAHEQILLIGLEFYLTMEFKLYLMNGEVDEYSIYISQEFLLGAWMQSETISISR